jgi:hypothetical protein
VNSPIAPAALVSGLRVVLANPIPSSAGGHPVSFNSRTSSITYFAIEPLLALYELLKALPYLLQPVSGVAQKVESFTAGNP